MILWTPKQSIKDRDITIIEELRCNSSREGREETGMNGSQDTCINITDKTSDKESLDRRPTRVSVNTSDVIKKVTFEVWKDK